MNQSELFAMTSLMQTYGGTFVSHIAHALRYADPANRQRLLDAFPDLVEKYGPKSSFMEARKLTKV